MNLRFGLNSLFLLALPVVAAAESEVVPEFSTVTAGVALVGGVVGYMVLKKKKGGKK